jgi:hypothetical protein
MAQSNFKKDQEINLIKNKENIVLVKINAGKHLLGVDPTSQSNQKGNTCWYYVSNRIRPRLGKALEQELKVLKKKFDSKQIILLESQSKALDDLLKRRQIEKLISNYRKELSKIDDLNNHHQLLSKMFKNQKTISKFNANTCLEWMELSRTFGVPKEELGSIKLRKKLLEEFILSQCDTLEEYIDNLQLTASRAVHETLKGFRKKEDCDHVQKLLDLEGKEDLSELSFSDKLFLFQTAVRNESRDLYGLKISSFNPADGFEALKTSLRKEGAICVGAKVGIAYYESKPAEGNYGGVPKEEYRVFFWTKEAKKINHSASHAILIVGAEKVKTKNGCKKTVLFMDPNDLSSLKEKDKIYRISFNNLILKMTNRYGYQGVMRSNTAFGFFANQEDINLVQEEFETLKPLLSSKYK